MPDSSTTHSEIRRWLIDNALTIDELLSPLVVQRKEALSTYDGVFHDEILNQFDEHAHDMLSIEVCKNLGCSVLDYYEVIDGIDVFELLNHIKTWKES